MFTKPVLIVAALLLVFWLPLHAVHELGHALAARATGGTVKQFVLRPLAISYTEISPNPAPLAVAWAGPLVGVAIPLILATLARLAAPRWRPYAVLFAGLCLIANGAYIGLGAFAKIGDAGDMLRHGAPMWTLLAFGAVTLPTGLYLCHRASYHFGFGRR